MAIEASGKHLKAPKEWPAFKKFFSKCSLLKTSELLLHAGPVGAYFFQFLDIDDDIKRNMIAALKLLEMRTRKSSTPGDRAILRRDLPITFTRLELALPVYTQTMVVHYLVFHAVEHLEETGPFHVSNMLDMERFQTVLKRCAKAKKNTMASVVNNYSLLQSALNIRLTTPSDWDWAVRNSYASRTKKTASVCISIPCILNLY